MRYASCVAILMVAGCVDVGRLAYDTIARRKIDEEISAKAEEAENRIEALSQDLAALEEGIVSPAAEFLSTTLADIKALAHQGVQRAQVAQLYWGAPTDLQVQIGDGKDKHEVLAFAGAAQRKHDNRTWLRRNMTSLVKAVAEFAADFAAVSVQTAVKRLVPWWVWWIVVPAAITAGVAALGILLYALYQRVTIRKSEQRIRSQDRALDDYDDLGEDLPARVAKAVREALDAGVAQTEEELEQLVKRERNKLGKDKLHLILEHAPRNTRRKARAEGDPIPQSHSCRKTHPTAREMLPGLNGNT